MLEPPRPRLGHGQLSWLMLKPLLNGNWLSHRDLFLDKSTGNADRCGSVRTQNRYQRPGKRLRGSARGCCCSPGSCRKQAGSWSR